MDICLHAQMICGYMLYSGYDEFIEIGLVSFMVDEGEGSLSFFPYDAMCSGSLVILAMRCCPFRLMSIGPYLASIFHSI